MRLGGEVQLHRPMDQNAIEKLYVIPAIVRNECDFGVC